MIIHQLCFTNCYLTKSCFFPKPLEPLCTAKESNNERKLDILHMSSRLCKSSLLIPILAKHAPNIATLIQDKMQQNEVIWKSPSCSIWRHNEFSNSGMIRIFWNQINSIYFTDHFSLLSSPESSKVFSLSKFPVGSTCDEGKNSVI